LIPLASPVICSWPPAPLLVNVEVEVRPPVVLIACWLSRLEAVLDEIPDVDMLDSLSL
jgi:hypothetical protein